MAVDDLSLRRGDSAGSSAVRIQQAQQQRVVNQLPNSPRMQTPQISNDIGRALMGVGGALNDASRAAQYGDNVDFRIQEMQVSQERERQQLSAASAVSESALSLQAYIANAKAQAENGAAGFTQNVEKEIDSYIENATKDATPTYANEYRQRMNAVRTSLLNESMNFEATERVAFKGDQFVQRAADNTKIAAASPEMIPALIEQYNADIAKDQTFTPQARRKLIKDNEQGMYLAAETAAIKQNPMAWLGRVNDGSNPEINTTEIPTGGVRGLRNNNPGNISKTSQSWDGEIKGSDNRFKTFSSPEAGIKAIGTNLLSYSRKGFDTVEEIINRWAPSSENNTQAYINSVATRLGVKPDAKLDVKNPAVLAGLTHAIIEHENGKNPYPDAMVQAGVNAAINKTPVQSTGMQTQPVVSNGSIAFDRLPYEKQQQLIEYAKNEQKGQLSNYALNISNNVVSTMVGDKPIPLESAEKQTIDTLTALKGSELTDDEKQVARQSARQSAAQAEKNWARNRESQMVTLFDTLDSNGGNVASLIASQPQLWAGASQEMKNKVNDYAGKVALGGNQVTDWQSYGSLYRDPVLLKATNLDAFRDVIAPRELTQLKKMQKDILEQPAIEQDIRTNNQVITGLLNQAGIKKPEQQNQFYSLLQQGIDQQLAASGKKKLSQEEVSMIANGLLTKVITDPGWLWDSKSTAFQVKVPDTERAKIIAALTEQGLPVSEYNVLKAHQAKLTRDAAR
jgi:hypothetical protein